MKNKKAKKISSLLDAAKNFVRGALTSKMTINPPTGTINRRAPQQALTGRAAEIQKSYDMAKRNNTLGLGFGGEKLKKAMYKMAKSK